ncbi:MAG: hypothetical protein ABI626_02565 [Sphingomicrobium sp.]
MRVQTFAIALAAAALAVVTTSASASEEAAAAPKKEAPTGKKTCRLFEAPTGSMIKPRICLTEEEWKKFDKDQAD